MSERLLQQEIAPVLERVDLSRVFGGVPDAVEVLRGYRSGRCRRARRCRWRIGLGQEHAAAPARGLDAELRGGKADGAGPGQGARRRTRPPAQRVPGFVYQFHHLLPEFSALENVAMPLYIRRVPRLEADAKARAMLRRWGLAIVRSRAGELSAASASERRSRDALVTQPACVLADEPTGTRPAYRRGGVRSDAVAQSTAQHELRDRHHDEGLARRAERTFAARRRQACLSVPCRLPVDPVGAGAKPAAPFCSRADQAAVTGRVCMS